MGQIFARANGDPIVAIARNAETDVADVVEDAPAEEVTTEAAADEPAPDDADETQEP
jgi:hypothetical protein